MVLEERFIATQAETGLDAPRHLTLVYAAGQGDGKDRVLKHFGCHLQKHPRGQIDHRSRLLHARQPGHDRAADRRWHGAHERTPWGRQTFTNGVAEVKGLNRSRMMRTREMPQVRVVIIPAPVVVNRTVAIGGIGKLGVTTFAPTPANACFKLMGMQQRSLLFFPSATMSD